MIIFEKGSKVNFVDEDNVFVGYNIFQQCYEESGWFICDEVKKDDIATENTHEVNADGINNDLADYTFDKHFFLRSNWDYLNSWEKNCDMVVFRLTKNGDGDKYLHIFNCHNGYYSHGIYTNGIDSVDKEFEL